LPDENNNHYNNDSCGGDGGSRSGSVSGNIGIGGGYFGESNKINQVLLGKELNNSVRRVVLKEENYDHSKSKCHKSIRSIKKTNELKCSSRSESSNLKEVRKRSKKKSADAGNSNSSSSGSTSSRTGDYCDRDNDELFSGISSSESSVSTGQNSINSLRSVKSNLIFCFRFEN